MNYQIDYGTLLFPFNPILEFPDFSDPEYFELCENYFHDDQIEDSVEFIGNDQFLPNNKNIRKKKKKGRNDFEDVTIDFGTPKQQTYLPATPPYDNVKSQEIHYQYTSPMQKPFFEDSKPNKQFSNDFMDTGEDEVNFLSPKKMQKKQFPFQNNQNFGNFKPPPPPNFINQNFVNQNQFYGYLNQGQQIYQQQQQNTKGGGYNYAYVPIIPNYHAVYVRKGPINQRSNIQQSHRRKNSNQQFMQQQKNTQNFEDNFQESDMMDTSKDNVFDKYDVLGLIISPSFKNRRNKNHLFTDSPQRYVPVIKKDKNIRFVLVFPADSLFGRCDKVDFIEDGTKRSEYKVGTLNLIRCSMCHRSGKSVEWINIPKGKWRIVLVSPPEKNKVDSDNISFSFELRFPNSQRKMMIKTNKNVYRFHMLLSTVKGSNNKMKVISLYFVYKIDSNGKKEKQAVKDVTTRMDMKKGKFCYEVTKFDKSKIYLDHDEMYHSSFSETREDGVFFQNTITDGF